MTRQSSAAVSSAGATDLHGWTPSLFHRAMLAIVITDPNATCDIRLSRRKTPRRMATALRGHGKRHDVGWRPGLELLGSLAGRAHLAHE